MASLDCCTMDLVSPLPPSTPTKKTLDRQSYRNIDAGSKLGAVMLCLSFCLS